MFNPEGNRDQLGNLIEVSRPTRQLLIQDLIRYFLATEPQVSIGGNLGEIDGEKAEATTCWGDVFNQGAGTFIQPDELASYLEPNIENPQQKSSLLIGETVSENGQPIAEFSPHKDCKINVFSGCNSDPAITISRLGNKPSASNEEIEAYQTALFGIAQHVFGRKAEGLGKPVLILDDDCAASVVTIGSALRIVREVVGLDKFSKLQVNVAVATAHSVVMLVEEAKRLGIPLELNVGYLSWGLTEGIGANKEHQNYLANIKNYDDGKDEGDIFTVGDMGNMARRVRGINLPWDRLRKDDYFDRQTAQSITWSYGQGRNLRLAFAYGGLMTEGMRSASAHQDEKTTVIMARAQRQTRDNNFVALFSHLIEPLYEYKRG